MNNVQWEYKRFYGVVPDEDLYMKTQGLDGWELVQKLPDPDYINKSIWYWKKLIQDNSKEEVKG